MKKSLMILLALIVIALVLVLTYTLGAKSQMKDEIIGANDTPFTNVVEDEVNEEPTTTTDPIKPDPIAVCAAKVETETKNRNIVYERGSILVSFELETTLARARADLDQDGYVYTLETRETPSGKEQIWGTVSVTKGKEFTEICMFRERPDIYFAGINPTIELHE